MAFVHRLRQCIRDAGTNANHRRLLNAKPHGDRIGGLEADPTDVAGKPIRIFGHDLDDIGAIGLVDPNSACGADPVAVQKHHDLANDLLFRPGGRDAPRA